MSYFLDFEKQIAALEGKIAELQHLANGGDLNISSEITKLQQKAVKLLKQTYGGLTAWQKVLVARHPQRPHFQDYVAALIKNFIPLAGDRTFGEDQAIIGGIGRFRGRSVVILGHEKGADTESRLKHSFGMAKPEGYRKAIRLMKLAQQFNLPLVSLVDTAGAFPGVEAEDRGQSEAIARTIEKGLNLIVPFISVVIGEGGSGGAIALATSNTIMMLEHSIYSVISPEGCASILWRDPLKKEEAAEAQKLTAQDLLKLKVIDHIIPEPLGAAHRDKQKTIETVGDYIEESLESLLALPGETLRNQRWKKFLAMEGK
jgi:acetyl-CoA carboxylase carboxyl transferase subunit alpha